MNMVIVILAMVIGYVALTAALNGVLGLFMHGLTIQKIFSYIFSPFAFLLGLGGHDAMYVAQLMGIKLATNEFVAMADLKELTEFTSAAHDCRGYDIPDIIRKLQHHRYDLRILSISA